MLALALIVPSLAHNPAYVAPVAATCDDVTVKSDCGFVGIDQQGCKAKGCCWKPNSGSSDPWCFVKGDPGPSPPAASCFVTVSSDAPFTPTEIDQMKALFLANVNIAGSGAVVAAPDHDTGPGGDYFYHWERDAALTMTSLQMTALADDVILRNYSAWVAARQAMSDTHGQDVRTEPKYEIPTGEIFAGAWCRPQNDGPGLRAVALLLYANALLDTAAAVNGVVGAEVWRRLDSEKVWTPAGNGTIQTSLEYLTSGGWSSSTCDLWEEVRDTDFFWNRITMKRALEAGAQFADKSGAAAAAGVYRATAKQIAAQLGSHVAGGGRLPHLIEAQQRQLDGAVIVGLNFNFDSPQPLYPPMDDVVAGTVAAYNAAFCSEYPINRDAAAKGLPGILYGRYPGDTYDGGNPWILTTAALAQLLYRVGHAAAGGSMPSATAMWTWAETLNAPSLATATGADAAKIFGQAADATLSRIAHYVRAAGIGFRLDEQIEKHNGSMTSAKSLTWSYAEVFNALLWRGKLREALDAGRRSGLGG